MPREDEDDNDTSDHEDGGFPAASTPAAVSSSPSTASKRNLNTSTLLPDSQLPFVGRAEELQSLNQAVEKISLEWMENPSQVVWLEGPQGVGKSAFWQQATKQGPFWKALRIQGVCEEFPTATQPFEALSQALNDLCRQLMPQKALWKPRLEESLGGEGPFVATIAPALCPLLECPPMDKRQLLQVFDTNTPLRLHRLAFAIRDLIQAVADYHPLVICMEDFQWVDPDSLQIWRHLWTTKLLQNVLFLGIHSDNLTEDHPLVAAKQAIQDHFDAQYQPETSPDDHLASKKESAPPVTGSSNIRTIQLQPLTKEELLESLSQLFPERQDDDEIPDLAELVFALTKGNPLFACQMLKLWNDTKFLTHSGSDWEWNRKRLKKEVKRCKDEKDKTYDSMEGVIHARLKALPNKIQFVVLVLAKMQLTQFRLEDTGIVDDEKNAFFQVFVAAAYHKLKRKQADPIRSTEELLKMAQKACHYGILQTREYQGQMKFVNNIIRKCASVTHSAYYEQAKKEKDAAQQAVKIGLYIATELSRLSAAAAAAPTGPIPNGPNKLSPAERKQAIAKEQQRERYKFLAVELLYQCRSAMDPSETAALAKINLEAAEIAISKSAFHTAIIYLERGVAVSQVGTRWEPNRYEVTLRTFLFLARMRLSCGRISAAKAAVEEIMDNAATIKDRVFANHVLMVLLQQEGKHEKAIKAMCNLLNRLGQVFPDDEANIANEIERGIQGLRKNVAKLQNQPLLNPRKMTDRKGMDVMTCLASLAELSREAKDQPNPYQELAMIQMMKLSLQLGFTRQYPMAFALFSLALMKRGLVKEAHRMGQIAEKIARLSDFYGGQSVALFHWHVSHWRRPYARNLEPVLRIYNAQVDSGDFCHVGFSINVYIQYHLASGFALDKLEQNLQLFEGLYSDYALSKRWQIELAQQAVLGLMGETANPTTFFGNTLAEQDGKTEQLQRAHEFEALEYFYFLRLFVAFFFHEHQVMRECLEHLKSPVEGVWVPWIYFIECFLLIQTLSDSKGKERKELKEKIDTLRSKLTDWYNNGNVNANAMSSILEAEWIIHKEGLKKMSAMKLQSMFREAIDGAAADGATHLEAFACERAGLHFHNLGVDGYCSEFLNRSHEAYDSCQYVAKVIDLETNYADILKIANRRVRPASAYLERNAQSAEKRSSTSPERQIGKGGTGEIRPPNVMKGLKKATRVLKKGSVSKTSRKVKDMFKKEKAESLWTSKSNKLSLDDGEADPENHPQSPMRKPMFGRGGGKKNEADDDDNPLQFSPSPTKVSSKKKGFFGRGKKEKKEDINDMIESPKPQGSRVLNLDSSDDGDARAMDLPFEVDDEEDDDGGDRKKKKKDKDKKKDKKKKKEKKKSKEADSDSGDDEQE